MYLCCRTAWIMLMIPFAKVMNEFVLSIVEVLFIKEKSPTEIPKYAYKIVGQAFHFGREVLLLMKNLSLKFETKSTKICPEKGESP